MQILPRPYLKNLVVLLLSQSFFFVVVLSLSSKWWWLWFFQLKEKSWQSLKLLGWSFWTDQPAHFWPFTKSRIPQWVAQKLFLAPLKYVHWDGLVPNQVHLIIPCSDVISFGFRILRRNQPYESHVKKRGGGEGMLNNLISCPSPRECINSLHLSLTPNINDTFFRRVPRFCIENQTSLLSPPPFRWCVCLVKDKGSSLITLTA